MNELLNRNIKEVIAEYPALTAVLGKFNIGCVTCSAGNCLFRDIVTIHPLTPEQERALFTAVAQIIYPGRTVELPHLTRKTATRAGFAPPIRELVGEHAWIKRVITLLPAVNQTLAAGLDAAQKQRVSEIVDFIRNFADRFHHAKEEDLLFKYFDEKSELLATMHRDHETGRAHVRAVVAGVEQGDAAAVAEHLAAYGALLTEHIRKEDEILYPWMNAQLGDAQIGRLFADFRAVDERFGGAPARYQTWVEQMEASLNQQRSQS